MRFCTKCGHQVGDDVSFCTRCGAALRPPAAAPAAGSPAEPDAAEPDAAQLDTAQLDTAEPDATEPAAPYPPVPPVAPATAGSPYGPEYPTVVASPAIADYQRPSWPEPPPREDLPAGGAPAGGWGGAAGPRDGQRGGQRRSPNTVLLAAAVVIVAGLVGLGVWLLVGRGSSGVSAASHSTTGAQHKVASHPTPSASVPGSPQAVSPSPATPSTPPASTPPAPAASGGSVTIGAGVGHPARAAAISAFASQYFTAINTRDYLGYTGLYEPGAVPVANRHQFLAGYRTTHDSHETLVGLAPTGGGGWAATVTFTSHQDPIYSATHTACTAWNVTMFLLPSGTSYLIGHHPASYHASSQACP